MEVKNLSEAFEKALATAQEEVQSFLVGKAHTQKPLQAIQNDKVEQSTTHGFVCENCESSKNECECKLENCWACTEKSEVEFHFLPLKCQFKTAPAAAIFFCISS